VILVLKPWFGKASGKISIAQSRKARQENTLKNFATFAPLRETPL